MKMVDVRVERNPDGRLHITTTITPPPYHTMDPFLGPSAASYGDGINPAWQTSAMRSMYGVNDKARLEAGIVMLQLMVEAIDARDAKQAELMRQLSSYAYGQGATGQSSRFIGGGGPQIQNLPRQFSEAIAAQQALAQAAERCEPLDGLRNRFAYDIAAQPAAAQPIPKNRPFTNLFKEIFR